MVGGSRLGVPKLQSTLRALQSLAERQPSVQSKVGTQEQIQVSGKDKLLRSTETATKKDNSGCHTVIRYNVQQ